MMQDRLGEHSAVVCMLLYRRPRSARRSRFGVAIGLPKQPSCPNPVSSSTTKRTLGEPLRARTEAGHAGEDSSAVRARTPGKTAPGWYSFSGIEKLLVADRPRDRLAPRPPTNHPDRVMLSRC